MMGKTHIAGALAAWSLVHSVFTRTLLTIPLDIVMPAVSLGGTVLSGLIPDIDQPGSIIDKELFGPLGKTRVGAMLSGLMLLAISVCLRVPVLFQLVVSSRFFPNLLMGHSESVSLILGLLGAVLVIMASLKHRGITHTLLGMGLFVWGADELLSYSHVLASWRLPLLTVFGAGYLSHLLLDLISDGIPLLNPMIKKRIKLPFSIRTGSFWDVIVIRFGLIIWVVYTGGHSILHALGIAL